MRVVRSPHDGTNVRALHSLQYVCILLVYSQNIGRVVGGLPGPLIDRVLGRPRSTQL